MARTKSSDSKWLDEVVKRLDQSAEKTDKGLEEIRSELNGLGKTAERQAASLEEHMRRTEANEKALTSLDDRMKPLESHVSKWAGAGKVLAVAGVLAGIATAVIEFLEHFT